ncbi:MAG: monovalent cation/H(+) antiporter subunit G [Phyllobacterium sp.]
MIHEDLPLWLAVLTAFFILVGSGLTLAGAVGLLRLRSFYERIHAPTLGTTCGTGSVLIASMLYFTVLQSRPVIHEILIGLFITVTTPVTLILLTRAALYRDRTEGNDGIPPFEQQGDTEKPAGPSPKS